MTAAHDYGDLHHLVDRLTPDQADAVRGVVLKLVESGEQPSPDVSWPPKWFGAITSGSSDIASRSEDILREEFGR